MKRKNANYLDLSQQASFIGMISIKWKMLVNMLASMNNSINTELAEEISKLYVEWGSTFNIRPDFAWSQMCIETDFLNSNNIKTKNNNFSGLTYLKKGSGDEEKRLYHSFDTLELGVIAHYSHLAWYIYPEHIDEKYCSKQYDPNHNEVDGKEHLHVGYNLNCLDKRWNPSPSYSEKISMCTNMIYELTAEGRNSEQEISHIQFIKNGIVDLVDVEIGEKEWKYIAIHHSAIHGGNVKAFRNYHRSKNWWDIGYNFVICNGDGGADGELQKGRSIGISGAHVKSYKGINYNNIALGICLVGWFDDIVWEHSNPGVKFENPYNKIPTKKQMETLIGLVKDLTEEYNIPVKNVLGHQEFPNVYKSCPGGNFNMDEFRNIIRLDSNHRKKSDK